MRMLIEQRPWRDYNQERESCAAKPDVECLVDVLRDEADEEGEDARDAEEGGADVFCEALAGEVLWEKEDRC